MQQADRRYLSDCELYGEIVYLIRSRRRLVDFPLKPAQDQLGRRLKKKKSRKKPAHNVTTERHPGIPKRQVEGKQKALGFERKVY